MDYRDGKLCETKACVQEKFGMKVSHLYIAQVKRKCGFRGARLELYFGDLKTAEIGAFAVKI